MRYLHDAKMTLPRFEQGSLPRDSSGAAGLLLRDCQVIKACLKVPRITRHFDLYRPDLADRAGFHVAVSSPETSGSNFVFRFILSMIGLAKPICSRLQQ
jgi:hypothetical protein